MGTVGTQKTCHSLHFLQEHTPCHQIGYGGYAESIGCADSDPPPWCQGTYGLLGGFAIASSPKPTDGLPVGPGLTGLELSKLLTLYSAFFIFIAGRLQQIRVNINLISYVWRTAW